MTESARMKAISDVLLAQVRRCYPGQYRRARIFAFGPDRAMLTVYTRFMSLDFVIGTRFELPDGLGTLILVPGSEWTMTPEAST